LFQVGGDDCRNSVQGLYVASLTGSHVRNMTTPNDLAGFSVCLFQPDLDNKRMTSSLQLTAQLVFLVNQIVFIFSLVEVYLGDVLGRLAECLLSVSAISFSHSNPIGELCISSLKHKHTVELHSVGLSRARN
jgi:hypothetical protein